MALRNLLRNRRRSLATFLALAIGTASILMFGGFRKSIEYSMHTEYVRSGGHLQIQHKDLFLYGSGNPVKYSIAGYAALIDAIRADAELAPMVEVVTPTLVFGGIASHADAGVSRTVIGVGVVPPDQTVMRDWNGLSLPLPNEPFALAKTEPDSAIVGTGVARVLLMCDALGVADCPQPAAKEESDGEALASDVAALAAAEATRRPGRDGGKPRIDLLAGSAKGAPNVVSLRIVSAQRQGFKELDEVYLVLHLAQAQRLVFGRDTPQVTAVVVQLKDSARLEAARTRIEQVIAQHAGGQPLAVLDFRHINPFFVQTVQMFDTIFGFVFVLIASIVLFTVGNTMSTAVTERTVEIGTVRSLGLRRQGVQRLFVIEGLMLGVAGTLAGALFALVVSVILNHLGLTWLPPGSGGRLPLLMLVWGQTGTIATTVLMLIAVAGLSAWWPARRGARLSIVDALRHA